MSAPSDVHALTEAIEAVAAPLARAHGVTLVDVDVRRGGSRSTLRFFIDKSGGVSITDCQRFSEEIGDLVDVSGLLPDSYDLEVSSPGLDRELRKDRELRWAVGRHVRLWTREPLDAQREFVGRLVEVGEDFLTLVEAPASGYPGRRQVPRASLTKVRLEVELYRSA